MLSWKGVCLPGVDWSAKLEVGRVKMGDGGVVFRLVAFRGDGCLPWTATDEHGEKKEAAGGLGVGKKQLACS
eukprot:scaffold3188_cov198-Pinguiococcus_pyrenoidosus.AAC.3